jgi:hypothetical protein
LSDRKLLLNPSYTGEAEAFWRSVTFPADDLARFIAAIPVGGFRWFRAPNVTPIEKYQRPAPSSTEPIDPPAA